MNLDGHMIDDTIYKDDTFYNKKLNCMGCHHLTLNKDQAEVLNLKTGIRIPHVCTKVLEILCIDSINIIPHHTCSGMYYKPKVY